ncbi:Malate:quinone oxidoreductase [[Actinomadura] parvosata subsp. kistnae]|uniref:Probable malate:quinone oxidoreductase n=1 Tax=[Actinomadura] parvosata subsp. kistnae TaxID=1909395 RepID=A0A1U9ZTT3_9ACTN|nr:malate dehydrogenase (quinone) [Nonomuraea sp. ATCC 55076]AQZ61356.1 malate dehydrogenase (acceptor) [Nonomuraea sp. ATCC 55076]SPL98021.1 Malate:quinone oxidoreductase [Actinomadura parvosata subsp. kistnae]
MSGYDVVLVGGGIMSATLGVLLRRVRPDWSILVLDRLDGLGLESSSPWNNAGTGHAGLCEFNYTPLTGAGSIDVSGAVAVGEQFQLSRQLWARLVEEGTLGDPAGFIRPVPHYSFAHGAAGVAHLRLRYAALRDHPLFEGMELTTDRDVMARWLPLMFAGRSSSERAPMAVCRTRGGTDVDYGVLTRRLFAAMAVEVRTGHEVRALRRDGRSWLLRVRDLHGAREHAVRAPFVFLGAGGGTLPLLQSANVPEIRDYGGFPISGRFLRTDNPELLARHHAKVYSHAERGAPPLSVPHLDTRVVDGRTYLMFGPFAAFSPRFLKRGRLSDLPRSITPRNAGTLLGAARHHHDLLRYLVGQLALTPGGRLRALRRFAPDARARDWELVTAGQRVQVVKRVNGRGSIAGFGTEVVTSAHGGLAALLGASPGASASVAIMLDVLERAFPDHVRDWRPALRDLLPSYGLPLANHPDLLRAITSRTTEALGLGADHG